MLTKKKEKRIKNDSEINKMNLLRIVNNGRSKEKNNSKIWKWKKIRYKRLEINDEVMKNLRTK